MRRIIFIAIFVSTLLFLTGCGEKPENTVSAFLDASKTFNLEKMKECVDPDNTEIATAISDVLNDENEELSKYFINYLTQNASKLEYKIIDSKVDNDNSIVTADVKFVDAAPILKATIAEIFPKIFAQAFSGIEMTDAQMNELVSTTMEAQIKLIDETYITKTIDIELIKISDKWYLSKLSDDLSNAILSNFIIAAKDLSDSFNSSGIDSGNGAKEVSVKDKLIEIDNFIIESIWNEGICEISAYLETGKSSTGEDIDIELTKEMLSKSMTKISDYGQYILSLGDEYTDLKNIWIKLSGETDKVYKAINNGDKTISTGIFVQYRDVFSEEVYKIE